MLFGNLSPTGGATTLVEAVTAIRNRASDLGLGRKPWSLVELGTDAEDHGWLCAWAGNLSRATIDTWIGSLAPYSAGEWQVTRQAAFGLLFLLLVTEVARRDATEGTLWAHVHRDREQKRRFSPFADEALFVQGQPTYDLKQAIEQAARAFNLRNVFGQSDLMHWFDTGFLQFGFTRRGFERIPWWLAGQGSTRAVNWLLEREQFSPVFADLWQALRAVRQNNMTHDQFLARVRANPWVLPEWHSDLLRYATQRMELGTAAANSAPVVEGQIPFLSVPTLHWEAPNPACFTVRLINLAAHSLEDTDYTLMVGGHECATILRQPDGTYAAHPSCDVALPFVSPTVIAGLAARDGETVLTQTLELFDSADEVSVFMVSGGRRVEDAWTSPLSTSSELFLLLSVDLALHPEPSRWSQLPGGEVKVCHLSAGWSIDTCVSLEGNEFWKPRLRGSSVSGSGRQEPEWAHGLQIRCARNIATTTPNDAEGIGPSVWFRVEEPFGTRVMWVRAEGTLLNPHEEVDTGRVIYGPIPLMVGGVHRRVTIGLERPTESTLQVAVVRRILDTAYVGFHGAVRQTPNGWEALGDGARLTVWDARIDPVKFFAPPDWEQNRREDGRDYVLIESGAWVGNIGRSGRPLGRLGGWGGSLSIRRRPYNSHASDTLLLASEVRDDGILSGVLTGTAHHSRKTTLRLQLRNAVEPDASYSVIWWDVSGEVVQVPGQEIEALSDAAWRCEVDGPITKPLALAIAYEGVRRGVWWTHDWSVRLTDLAAEKPGRTAALLRYLKLPLVSPEHLSAVRGILKRHPERTLSSWLADRHLPEPLRYSVDEGWPVALRIILDGWVPDISDAKHLLRCLGGTKDQPFKDRLLTVTDRLTALCPVLAASVVRELRDGLILPQKGEKGAKLILDALARSLAGVCPNASEQDLALRKDELRDAAASVADVAPEFFTAKHIGLVSRAREMFHGPTSDAVHRNNLAVAIVGVDAFRRLVAVTLIQDLIPRK